MDTKESQAEQSIQNASSSKRFYLTAEREQEDVEERGIFSRHHNTQAQRVFSVMYAATLLLLFIITLLNDEILLNSFLSVQVRDVLTDITSVMALIFTPYVLFVIKLHRNSAIQLSLFEQTAHFIGFVLGIFLLIGLASFSLVEHVFESCC